MSIPMTINPYDGGRNDMREELLAFIYERFYLYNRTFQGPESHCALEFKRLINEVRDMHASEIEAQAEQNPEEE